MSAKKVSKEISFEDELLKLEALTEQMESGELPLDALLAAYEEGSKLAKALMERLDQARAKLSEVKMAKDGSLTVTQSNVAVQSSLLDDLPAE